MLASAAELREAEYGIDADRMSGSVSPIEFLRRRFGGRFVIDPFGFDPQLADVVLGPLSRPVAVDVIGAEHLPPTGSAALVVNRGFGLLEPTVLAVAVRRVAGRRVRLVGIPAFGPMAEIVRRFGGIDASAPNVGAALAAERVIAIPLGPSRPGASAGAPPLELVQAAMGHPLIPVAVRASGPLRTPTRWTIEIGPMVTTDVAYPVGDPLGAAELAEALRDAVHALMQGLMQPSDESAAGTATA